MQNDHQKSGEAYFKAHGLPSSKLEDWRYTNLRQKLTALAPALPSKVAAPLVKEPTSRPLTFLLDTDAIHLPLDLPSSISCKMLDLATPERSAVNYDEFPMLALNDALCHSGLVIEIGPNTHLEEPLSLVYASNRRYEDSLQNFQIHLVLKENASLSVREEMFNASSTSCLTNSAIFIHLAKNARLTWLHELDQMPSDQFIRLLHVSQMENSVFNHYALLLGEGLIREDIAIHLQEKGASTTSRGFYFAAHESHSDIALKIKHHADATTSHSHFRGMADQQGHAIFSGKILVDAHINGVDAALLNKNILLSQQAQINTKPLLEIYSDDVKCSHGATVGDFDETMLFYLKSRGIKEHMAKVMLAQGFSREFLTGTDLPDTLKQRLQDKIDNKMNAHFEGH